MRALLLSIGAFVFTFNIALLFAGVLRARKTYALAPRVPNVTALLSCENCGRSFPLGVDHFCEDAISDELVSAA